MLSFDFSKKNGSQSFQLKHMLMVYILLSSALCLHDIDKMLLKVEQFENDSVSVPCLTGNCVIFIV